MNPDPKKINAVTWVKSKERPEANIAINSFYVLGHAKKYFRHLDLKYEVGKFLSFKSGQIFFEETDLQKAEELLLQQGGRLAKLANKISDNFLIVARDYQTFLKKYHRLDFSKTSKSELAKIYHDFAEWNYALIPYSFIMSIVMERVASEQIVRVLKNLSANPERTFLKLMVNSKTNLTTQEYFDRLNLAIKAKNGKNLDNSEFVSLLQKHLKRYGFLNCYSPTDSPISLGGLKKVVTLTEKSGLKNQIRNAELTRQTRQVQAIKLIKRLKLARPIKELILVLQKNIWIRTHRRELMSLGFFTMRPMYLRLAKLMHVPFSDLSYIAVWEIEKFLTKNKKPSLKDLRERKKDFILIKLEREHFIVTGGDIKKIGLLESESAVTKILTGQAVYPGKIKTQAILLKNKNDVRKFIRGRILVAHSVFNWMLPAVERCGGIVTDAGGVLSHTAVLAREFHKPCITGTKIATQIFKNGDLVELNADMSLVKKVTQ